MGKSHLKTHMEESSISMLLARARKSMRGPIAVVADLPANVPKARQVNACYATWGTSELWRGDFGRSESQMVEAIMLLSSRSAMLNIRLAGAR